MYRYGMKILQIMRALGVSRKSVEYLIQMAIDDENDAHHRGVRIYDGQKGE